MIARNISDIDNIKNDFFNNGIVYINVDNINIDLLKQIGSFFGNLCPTTLKTFIENERYVHKISENAILGSKEVDWHRDMTYDTNECHGTLLAYIDSDTPTYTEFSDCNIVYNNLSLEDKSYLEDLEITYSIPKKYVANQELVTVTRPCLMVHPITKDHTVYFSPETILKTNKHFDQDFIIKQCEQNTFKHYWNKGDILLWDNRRMMHRRPKFKGHRELWRLNFKYDV